MPWITVTPEAARAIRAAADHPQFRDTSRPAPNGMLSISLSDETLSRLTAYANDGESLSDAIIRLVLRPRLF